LTTPLPGNGLIGEALATTPLPGNGLIGEALVTTMPLPANGLIGEALTTLMQVARTAAMTAKRRLKALKVMKRVLPWVDFGTARVTQKM
jgi:hypothetical protein